MLVVEPRLFPNSAVALWVRILNSLIAVHRRLENKASIHAIEIIGAVNQEVVRLGTLAIHRVTLAFAQRRSCLL